MKTIEKAFVVLSIIILLWVFASWAEIVSKNLKPNPVYHEWNAFVLVTKGDR